MMMKVIKEIGVAGEKGKNKTVQKTQFLCVGWSTFSKEIRVCEANQTS